MFNLSSVINLNPSFGGSTPGPVFLPGELVFHRRYHYRGVIVAYDSSCRASEAWYQGNKTQPDRNQPWYHVLVHGSRHTTYVAQINLETDREGGPIDHPLVDYFFKGFGNGVYERNERPWGQEG